MSLLDHVGAVTDAKRQERWMTLLDADETIGAPEFRLKIRYVSDRRVQALTRDFRDRNDDLKMGPSDQLKFREEFCRDAVCEWDGATSENLQRLCEDFARDPSTLAGLNGKSLPFDYSDLATIARKMTGEKFQLILSEAMDLNRFAVERLRREKKEHNSQSDTSLAS